MLSATELDIMMPFMTLSKGNHLTALDAMTLVVDREEHPLRFYCDENKVFSYQRFFKDFLKDLEKCLMAIKDELPVNIHIPEPKCKTFRESDVGFAPFTHCKCCIYSITHTKAGACLVFRGRNYFHSEPEEPINLTIDIIPLFPVNFPSSCKNVMDVFNLVNLTLLERKPENWLKHLKGVIKCDRILPESHEELLNESSTNGTYEVGMKLLHYGPEDNCIVRPAQVLNVEDFSRFPKEIKEVYCTLKYIKSVLNVDIKSYLLKKVILRNEFIIKVESGGTEEDHLFEAMNYSQIKRAFQGKIDYELWRLERERGIDRGIPLRS